MTNRFFAGQTNYIEEMNALDGETGDHIADATGAHAATAISNTPAGNIAATTVQAAINELDTEKLSASATTLPASFTASSLTSVGTLTALTVSGTSTLGVTRASTADSATPQFGVVGTTKGMRVLTTSAGTAIDGVDNTLLASFQPLFLRGSTVSLSSGGSEILLANINGVSITGVMAVSGQASFAAGSAAAPSVKVGAGNEGLYSLASGMLGLAANGRLALRLETVASSVNYLYGYANSTGVAPVLRALGSDANVSLIFSSQGTGSVDVFTNGATVGQFRVNHIANSVNIIQAAGAATGGAPSFAVGGTDTNIPFAYYTKGTGTHQFFANGGLQMLIGAPASSVNYWQFFGAATAGALNMYAGGTDTNIGAYLATKGSGGWRFATGGGDQFRIMHTASAVNFFSAYGGGTGNAPTLYADGTDAAVNAGYSLKGGGAHVFYTGSTSAVQLVIAHTASSVNWPVISGSATGNAVTISTGGSDTNRSISLTAAGTGLVQITNDSLRIVTSKTPASASATGTQGQIAWDASYIYVCTATDTWKRAAIATW